ncbi:putative activity regulator of membrane protease YbbK [Vibrio astriarenae]|uniref:NfeD family protein n=1 Tax=Vibrio astriarenae TaxID=1481923 RepID=A0A7Z2T233_9VIBR|nr:NfeD family protein [Vibrio astriarenae]QIA62738.1 NfeD family protein [Vibrio astriarenae]GAL14863.1 putative activity regulator of membrane protease YbbK [Vibrio sp. C7]
MIVLLEQMNHWHWLAFGLALLAVELLGTAGYFLWIGLSAMLIGILMTFIPMSWQLQWVAFAVFSLVTAWLWWRRQLSNDKASDLERDLNQKEKQLVGTIIVLEDDIQPGKNRVRIGDTTWSALSDVALSKGCVVEVTEMNGITLTLKEREK